MLIEWHCIFQIWKFIFASTLFARMDEAFIQLGVQRNLVDGHDKFREKKVVGVMTNIKATMEEFKAQM